MNPIQPNELRAPELTPVQQGALLLALNSALLGNGRVSVSFTYRNQTDAPRSRPGIDHVEMPGVAPNTMIGHITRVARAKDDGHVFFGLACLTRGDGATPYKPRYYRPEGVLSFVVTGFTANPEKLRETAEVQ